MLTHLCRLALYKSLDDGTQIVNFTDLESNLRLTLKLSKDSQVLLQTDDKGLILLEFHINGGKVIYPIIPEVSAAIKKNARFEILSGIFLCIATVPILFILFFILFFIL